MQSLVYRSTKKSNTYIYVSEEKKLEELPEGLERLLGTLEFVMNVDLDNRTSLANADISEVKNCLTNQGYYLQLPREEHISI